MDNKYNSCSRGFGGGVGMKSPGGTVDEKHTDIRIFMEGINISGEICLVCLQ